MMNFTLYFKDVDLVLKFHKEVYALSTTVDGGFRKVDTIVFANVSDESEAEKKIGEYRSKFGDKCIVFLTAVKPRESFAFTTFQDCVCIITAGLDNLFTIVNGDVKTRLEDRLLGTINIFVHVDRELSIPDMIELVQTITYAKVAALIDHDVLTVGSYALGTTSDAAAVTCPKVCESRVFTGPYTQIGRTVIKCVYEGLSTLLKKLNFSKNRPIADRIMEFLNIDKSTLFREIEEAARECVVGTDLSRDFLNRTLEEFRRSLEDVNIQLLLRAALEIERLARVGALPGHATQKFYVQDSPVVNIDEIFGSIAAMYVSDLYGFFNFYYLDRNKPELFRKLPPMLDDVLLGILAGVLSRLFRRGLP